MKPKLTYITYIVGLVNVENKFHLFMSLMITAIPALEMIRIQQGKNTSTYRKDKCMAV